MRVYGPYISKKDGRRYVKIYSNNKVRTTLYARYLMEKHLGRQLEPNEQVHHKDENKLNDVIENYEIKLLGVHQAEHKKYKDNIKVNCVYCGIEFELTPLQQRQRTGNTNRNPNQAGPFCSKRCAGVWRNR